MLFWAVICAGATGVLMGLLLLRVYAVLAASLVAVIAGVVLVSLTSLSLFPSVLYCANLLATLQIAYLVGGALSCASSRET